jgi:hypothetical protein
LTPYPVALPSIQTGPEKGKKGEKVLATMRTVTLNECTLKYITHLQDLFHDAGKIFVKKSEKGEWGGWEDGRMGSER